ncbi:hypothetical protein F5050DRAFT_1772563 [Lentinula boryana]|uniref:Secreted protein n=1 Tax=Lentinula boryana TaxID=40481 RepID=A0ABQ8Q870_9AGAR|nr:hypothetical protein F5050DRAFT_1772563 [Lentinula boryana]
MSLTPSELMHRGIRVLVLFSTHCLRLVHPLSRCAGVYESVLYTRPAGHLRTSIVLFYNIVREEKMLRTRIELVTLA